MKSWFKSKTKIGAVLMAASRLVTDYENPQAWSEAVAIILVGFGVRDALNK